MYEFEVLAMRDFIKCFFHSSRYLTTPFLCLILWRRII